MRDHGRVTWWVGCHVEGAGGSSDSLFLHRVQELEHHLDPLALEGDRSLGVRRKGDGLAGTLDGSRCLAGSLQLDLPALFELELESATTAPDEERLGGGIAEDELAAPVESRHGAARSYDAVVLELSASNSADSYAKYLSHV